MKIVVRLQMEVNIATTTCNVKEIFDAVSKARDDYTEKLALTVIEAYQEEVVRTLTSPERFANNNRLSKSDTKTVVTIYAAVEKQPLLRPNLSASGFSM